MTPEQFIAKWQANRRGERQSAQEHFIDLCGLLGEPTPNTDPDGSTYAFEKGAAKAVGGKGWADVWRRNCFAWEYKGKHRDLDGAYRQFLLYAGPLGNPPLLVVSDIERIVVRTNWTNAISERHDILLPELTDPARRHLLKAVLSDRDRLRPAKTREALTRQAATEFAELATSRMCPFPDRSPSTTSTEPTWSATPRSRLGGRDHRQVDKCRVDKGGRAG